MDQLLPPRGRSPAMGDHLQPQDIKRSHSPSPSPARPFTTNIQAVSTNNTIGLGLSIDPSIQQFASSQPDFTTFNAVSGASFLTAPPSALGQQDIAFDPSQSFGEQLKSEPTATPYTQSFLDPQQAFAAEDFIIYPSSAEPPASLFEPQQQPQQDQQPSQFSTPDLSNMATTHSHNSPTPPHLLGMESRQPGSVQHSPNFSSHQFSHSPGGRSHSRNVSLGPEAALLPGQDWTGFPFQTHRRSASDYSEASSIGGHSPSLVAQESFPGLPEHVNSSPLLRPEDGEMYRDIHNGFNSISISSNPTGRSPSHSPAISPRIAAQALPDLNGGMASFALQVQNDGYSPYMANPSSAPEAFPSLPSSTPEIQMTQMPAPTIAIDYAPNPASRSLFEGKPVVDTGALTLPEQRGRQRRRANTDPYSGGTGMPSGRSTPSISSLSPNMGSDASSHDSSRSLSPLDRSIASSPGRHRRVSTSAVPNNARAIRLADPEFAASTPNETASTAAGSTKRAQKHPATFQCTLCSKRFTRAYNLRSHLRTHTDERPFVCSFCGKAFARQHDRKRHEGLHSGEKRFMCKGELKTGGDWGCGRRFARADALGRHFRSEAGRICIKPLLDEEFLERQRTWQEQEMQAHAAAQQQSMMMVQQPQMGSAAGYPMDANGDYTLPAALLAQYPALAQVNWSSMDVSGGVSGMEDDLSGRSSFDASDYEDGDEAGYVSGSGTGFGDGGMSENYSDAGYTSDITGR